MVLQIEQAVRLRLQAQGEDTLRCIGDNRVATEKAFGRFSAQLGQTPLQGGNEWLMTYVVDRDLSTRAVRFARGWARSLGTQRERPPG